MLEINLFFTFTNPEVMRVNIIKARAIAKAIHKVGIFPAGKDPMRVVPKAIEAFPPLKLRQG